MFLTIIKDTRYVFIDIRIFIPESSYTLVYILAKGCFSKLYLIFQCTGGSRKITFRVDYKSKLMNKLWKLRWLKVILLWWKIWKGGERLYVNVSNFSHNFLTYCQTSCEICDTPNIHVRLVICLLHVWQSSLELALSALLMPLS